VKYSVIITNRHEKHVNDTARRVLETSAPCEVMVVNDGPQGCKHIDGVEYLTPWTEPLGLQPCRDYGIARASGDVVIVMDAHMQFKDGSGWADKLAAHIRDNPRDVVCPTCLSVCPSTYKLTDDCGHCVEMRAALEEHGAKAPAMPQPRYAASIAIRDYVEKDGHAEHKVFPSRWDYRNGPGRKQSVLGGCYAMRRDWYMAGLRRPWQEMRGWGMSEQTLSITNWLCGGGSHCLPVGVGHLFRRSGTNPYPVGVGTREGLDHNFRIWFNRVRLIEVLPMSDGLRHALRAWLDMNHMRSGLRSRIDGWRARDWSGTAGFLAGQDRDLHDYIDEWGIES